jgi:DNA polymerase
MIYLDFETYSECDLRKHGAWIYAQHPSTEILCMAYKIDDGRTKISKGPEWPNDTQLDYAIGQCMPMEAHNAFFEYCIWRFCAVKKYDWPWVPNKVWNCSAARCAAYGLPRSLEKAAIALGLEKQKDMEGRRIMMKLSKPRKPSKNDPSTRHTDPKDYKKLYSYCVDDVETEYALAQAIPQLSKQERKYWRLDQLINRRGVTIDTESVEGALGIINTLAKENNEKISKLTDGRIKTTGQRDKIIEFCEDEFVFIDDLTADTVKGFLKKDLPENVREILTLRQQSSLASVKKLQRMVDMADKNNRVHETIRYCGAERTGRWAGSGIQPQNFPRKKFAQEDITILMPLLRDQNAGQIQEVFGPAQEIIKSALRPMIIAAPGKVFISADYKSIEARVLAWMTNTIWAIRMFRFGEDPYIDMAAAIYGIPASEIDDKQRFLGKIAILALGYGMGFNRFVQMCYDAGIIIGQSIVKKAFNTYREKYWQVKNYWNDIEALVKACIRDKDTIHINHLPAKLKIEYAERTLNIHLPSGRILYYHDPKLELKTLKNGHRTTQITYSGIVTGAHWKRIHTWGGKLTENIDQAISRDLLANAMLKLEKAGYPVVLTVHDEIVCEVEKKKANLNEFKKIMCDLPAWAKGFPIATDEGWVGERFRKA